MKKKWRWQELTQYTPFMEDDIILKEQKLPWIEKYMAVTSYHDLQKMEWLGLRVLNQPEESLPCSSPSHD